MLPKHSFGGSPLDRYVYEFETPDPSGMGEPPPGGEPPAEPEPPAWTGPTQEEWQQVQATNQALAEFVQRQQQVYAPPQQGETEPDFYDDPNAWLDYKLGQRLAPIEQTHQRELLDEAEERAMDILHDLSTRDGEFDKDLARARADRLLPQFQAKYGNTPQAAQAALEAAAQQQREWEAQFGQRAVAQHTNHIATLAGAPGEPGSTIVSGVQQRTMPNYREGGRVTDRFFGPNRET